MEDEMEFQAMGIHFRLAELHRLAKQYNEKKGNRLLQYYHHACQKVEERLALEHFKLLKKEV